MKTYKHHFCFFYSNFNSEMVCQANGVDKQYSKECDEMRILTRDPLYQTHPDEEVPTGDDEEVKSS